MAQRCSGTEVPTSLRSPECRELISYHARLRRRSGFTYTHSLTDAVLPGRTGFFVEAVCTEGVPPSLKTAGPFENWPGRQTTPEKTVRRTGSPVCGENAQTEAVRTHRSWEVDFKSTASNAWQRVNIGCTRSHYSFSFSNGPFSQDTARVEHRTTGDPAQDGTHTVMKDSPCKRRNHL